MVQSVLLQNHLERNGPSAFRLGEGGPRVPQIGRIVGRFQTPQVICRNDRRNGLAMTFDDYPFPPVFGATEHIGKAILRFGDCHGGHRPLWPIWPVWTSAHHVLQHLGAGEGPDFVLWRTRACARSGDDVQCGGRFWRHYARRWAVHLPNRAGSPAERHRTRRRQPRGCDAPPDGDEAQITIADDGRGFDATKRVEKDTGLGLVSMSERVRTPRLFRQASPAC